MLVFHITDSAHAQLRLLLSQEGKPFFRIRVKGGGCAGFEYVFALESEKKDNDFILEACVLIDPYSAPCLINSTLDYIDNANGTYFHVLNPQAKSSCGCRKSFSL